ncbi:MAG: hypothetical protein LBM03_01280 [Erysipelotrichaceae bacterium]|jgi:hypothetical protein|nr:hypothetical protein [Erysipelotrichaceae bacterium]
MGKNKIKYKSYEEVAKMSRFDFAKKVRKPMVLLKPVMFLLSFPGYLLRHSKVKKINMKGLKPPYFMLVNHNSFFDFKVATVSTYPRVGSSVVAIDGFINMEWLLRWIGCLGKRKFVNDTELVFNIKHIIKNKKGIVTLYPEARYALVGTDSPLPDSLGKMVKMFGVPVVVLLNHGHHLGQPVWNLKKRKNRTESELTQILTTEDIKNMNVEQINEKIRESFVYDDYKWQKDNNIIIDEPFRAEGLHLPLYKCPICGDEHHMTSKGADLICTNCGTTWHMNELGELESDKKSFTHIPDWFNWERAEVRKEIESGTYDYEADIAIDSLPSSKGFYRLGNGHLSHTKDGFVVTGDFSPDFKIVKRPLENFGVHIEYNYFGKGNCVSLSTKDDTYYMFPLDQSNSVTKLHFAAEELYDITKKEYEKLKKEKE